MAALYGTLAAASFSVALATRRAPHRMLSNQVNAWWRIFPVVSVVLLTYPLGLVALACLVYVLAVLELMSHYPGQRRHFLLGTALIFVSVFLLHFQAQAVTAIVLLAAIFLQGLLFLRLRHKRSLIWLLVLITAEAMAMLTAFSSLPFPSPITLAWLFYLFILTAMNDVGQFIFGKLFGRAKLAPRISPNKTWQGAFGGLAVSLFVSQTLGAHLTLAGSLKLASYAILLSLGGLAGDLMFAAAKRYLSIKDFSHLIPGHGGILDRVDSLIVTAPLLYCLLRISA